MREGLELGHVVVVKTWRKSNGAVGSGRKGNSGKKAVVYEVDATGARKEVGREKGATFTDLSQKLRRAKLIPDHVSFSKYGETKF